jgi:hypothetical protein
MDFDIGDEDARERVIEHSAERRTRRVRLG